MEAQEVIDEALHIVSTADQRDVVLRILGAVAFRIHCPNRSDLFDTMSRPITDMDFAAYSGQKREVHALFKDLGYSVNDAALLMYDSRYILDNPKRGMHADVFFDCLNMCHIVDFDGRLKLDYPTISITDLLLEKMQIVNIEQKDIKDTMILFVEHDLGVGRECIDSEYLCSILSSDWGYYRTVSTNLEKVRKELHRFPQVDQKLKRKIELEIRELERVLLDRPKSLKWRMRAKIGTRQKWYREVEERTR
jgi:hypothetical protein